MIELINVTKELKNKKVLNQINLKINEGELILLHGHNGSGKSMLLRMIAGLISPTDGTASINSDNIGVVIEKADFISNFTGYEMIAFLTRLKSNISKEEIQSAFVEMGLENMMYEKIKKYSLGMKQKLALIQSYIENQKIILLDEPFNALDRKSVNNFVNKILKLHQQGKTIIIASHLDSINKMLTFDSVYEMENGMMI